MQLGSNLQNVNFSLFYIIQKNECVYTGPVYVFSMCVSCFSVRTEADCLTPSYVS